MMNDKVALLRRSTGRNAANERVDGWVPVAEVWCSVKFQTGAEVMRAGADVSVVKCSVRTRARGDVDASMRVRHRRVDYEVKAVMPDTADRDYMFLVCEGVK